jgi:hypothetical protein
MQNLHCGVGVGTPMLGERVSNRGLKVHLSIEHKGMPSSTPLTPLRYPSAHLEAMRKARFAFGVSTPFWEKGLP